MLDAEKIDSWEYVDGVDTVYDLEVEDNHNYYLRSFLAPDILAQFKQDLLNHPVFVRACVNVQEAACCIHRGRNHA